MIRKAKENDILDIKELLLQVCNVHANVRPDIFVPNMVKYNNEEILNIIIDNNTPVFVYELDGKVIGHLFCIIKSYKGLDYMVDRSELYIDDLVVHENYRRRGIGKELYLFALDYAKENNYDYVTLNVWADNEDSLRFYEKLGLRKQKIYLENKLK